MPIPDFQSMMLPVLQIAADGQEHNQSEVRDALALKFQLTQAEREEMLPSGRQARFSNRVAWSTAYLRKAGLLENSKRGVFHITEHGRELLKNNPSRIDINLLKQYPGIREWHKTKVIDDPDLEPDPEVEKDRNNENSMADENRSLEETDKTAMDLSKTDLDMNYWIFQANPKLYDLVGAANELKELSWRINRYKENIHVGDIIYFWEAGKDAGIVAVGKISSIHAAISTPDEEMKFNRGREGQDYDQAPFFGALISIERVLSNRIRKQDLMNNSLLRDMHILRQPQGTNFKVTQDEAKALEALINEIVKLPPYTIDQLYNDTGKDKDSLDRWLAAIERKKQAIIYGPPGTGKTYLAKRLADYLISDGNGFKEVIQFHPAYAYEDFIQGIRPQIREDGILDYQMVRGRFLEFCDKANHRQGKCVLIIDEINRANLSRVFGELMYLLEYRNEERPLSGGGILKIPSNVRIIGTMNTADRSIALVDHALRRRFAFLSLEPDYDILRRYHQNKATGFPVDGLIQELTQLNNHLDRHYMVGISFFLRDNLKDEIKDIWEMEILPYLEEYFVDQPEKLSEFSWDNIKKEIGL
jgi:5-methylcytosine-specific restriction enzyme B